MDNFGETLFIAGLSVLVFMNMLALIGLIQNRNDIADVGWGIAISIAAVSSYVYGRQEILSTIATGLVIIWGVRLSWHIGQRHRGKPEDFRYQRWRQQWGAWFYVRSYLQVFMLQGLLAVMVALPVIILNATAETHQAWQLIGFAVWAAGFGIETIADRQLRVFVNSKKSPGAVLERGLWKYSRHPNYFGEISQWWGLGIVALGAPYGWLGVIGPLTITGLIGFVSGIPLVEGKLAQNPAYRAYQKRTSPLIPWPPRTT